MKRRLRPIVCGVFILMQSYAALAGEKLSVAQYGNWLAGLPWLVAKDEGYLRDEGLDIDGFVSSQGGGNSVRNTLASSTPFGEVPITAAISAIQEGLPVVMIYAGTIHPGEIRWVTSPDKPINAMRDLIGKTVGYTAPKSGSEMMLLLSLEAAGVRSDQVKMISTGGFGGAASMLAAGTVDAIPIVDPVLTTAGDKYKLVFWPADVIKELHTSVGLVSRPFAAENPDKVRKLIRARRKAVDLIYASSEKAVSYCAQYLEIDRSLAEKLLPKFIKWRFWSPGYFTRDGLDSGVKGMRLIGTFQGEIDWSAFIDTKYLPEDLKATR